MSKTNTSRRHKKEKQLNPALKIRDFYSFGLQILNEINNAREHPDEFLEKLKELQGTIEDTRDNCLFIENVPFIYTNLSDIYTREETIVEIYFFDFDQQYYNKLKINNDSFNITQKIMKFEIDSTNNDEIFEQKFIYQKQI